jgi:hypothetical protein
MLGGRGGNGSLGLCRAFFAANLTALVLADGRASTVFTLRLLTVVLADGRASAVFTVALAAVVLTQRPAATFFAESPLAVVLALTAFLLGLSPRCCCLEAWSPRCFA